MIKRIIVLAILLFVAGCKSTIQDPRQEGWVVLVFDINKSGNPINITVVDSYPDGVFDNEGIKALTKWKYKPKLVDGTPVLQKRLKVKLDFKPNNES